MSLVQQIKRAAINHGMYKGNVDDNWEPADRLMFHRLCSRFHGNYTDHPSRNNQNPEFLEWLDRYKDLEYSEKASTHTIVNPGGADLRQFIPDRQPVNTEGASRQEAKQRDAMVNENAIKLTPPQKKDSVPDPKKVVEEEKKNELQNQDSLRSSDPTGTEANNSGSSESREDRSNDKSNNQSQNEQRSSENLDSSEQKSNGDQQEKDSSGEAGETANPTELNRAGKPASLTNKPASITGKPAPITGKPAPITSNTIKTR